MNKPAFTIFLVSLLIAVLFPSGNAYWPIVLQVSRETPDFEYALGSLQTDDGRVMLGTNESSTDTVVSYMFSLLEFPSFKTETLQVMEAYLQIYPADIHAYEYGKTGNVDFNSEIVKEFSLTHYHFEEESFLDPSNYRFTPAKLDFPVPMYGYFSNRSVFIPIPVRLLDSRMSVTLRIDPQVLWEIFIISLIIRINPENTTPWWLSKLPFVASIASVELVGLAAAVIVLRKALRKKKANI